MKRTDDLATLIRHRWLGKTRLTRAYCPTKERQAKLHGILTTPRWRVSEAWR